MEKFSTFYVILFIHIIINKLKRNEDIDAKDIMR